MPVPHVPSAKLRDNSNCSPSAASRRKRKLPSSSRKLTKRGPFTAFFLLVAAVCAAFLCTPVWGMQAVTSYEGDLVAVLYLLSFPTLCLFLAAVNAGLPWARAGSRAVYVVVAAFAFGLGGRHLARRALEKKLRAEQDETGIRHV